MELDQNLIEEGKALVVKCESSERMTCEARLALGRWADKVAPVANVGSNQHSGASPDRGTLLEEYADAIGIAKATLIRYRDIAIAWGDAPADGLAWSVLRKLAYRTDRDEFVAAVFTKYGKVTEGTIEKYIEWMREENRRREEMLQQTPEVDEIVDYEDEDWEDEEESEEIPVVQPVSVSNQQRRHGFSAPVRKLFSVVEHIKDARNYLREEGIAEADIANDENYEQVLSAVDVAITEMMSYREALTDMRVRAGLSPEVG